jgi:hypothetical protein
MWRRRYCSGLAQVSQHLHVGTRPTIGKREAGENRQPLPVDAQVAHALTLVVNVTAVTSIGAGDCDLLADLQLAVQREAHIVSTGIRQQS